MQTKGSLDKPVQTSHVKENHVTQSNQHDNIDGISLLFEKAVNGSNMISANLSNKKRERVLKVVVR